MELMRIIRTSVFLGPGDVKELKLLWGASLDGVGAFDNAQRLNIWKARYKTDTGLAPINHYHVGFCDICNKPHWFVNDPTHTVRCISHK